MGIIIIVLSLFLCWQSIGANHWLSFCNRLIVPAWNNNLYCIIAGEVTSRTGIALGVIGLIVGVVYILEQKKLTAVNIELSEKGVMSYRGILIFEALLAFITIL